MPNQLKQYRPFQYFSAWIVHLFTASAAFLGLWSLLKIHDHQYIQALWLMAITVVIDAIDGTFARLVHVKSVLPKFDGALLDNIVDYLNYVITPCFFLLVKPDMLPPDLALLIVFGITLTSAYQFCQANAKTPDHFFKGFPCYWNISVFYMFIFETSMQFNAVILVIFSILIFVPIKYVYPSRLDYLTQSKYLKRLMHTCSIIYGISSTLILWDYPLINPVWSCLSLGYIIMYLFLSFYRTYSPMILAKIAIHRH
jgi:phosphatidylcholine synthase